MKRSFEDFAVAGKRQGLATVLLSLLGTIVGASATIGVADRVFQIGFSAFWWLGVGAIGLFLQGCFLSERIRELNANTLPDIAHKTVGRKASLMLALIIVLSWIGIVAAQFVSIAKILMFLLDGRYEVIVTVIAGMVILYTFLGGQISVVKTDVVQSVFIAVGIVITFFYLYVVRDGDCQTVFQHVELLSSDFTMFHWVLLLFVTGGTFFLGPDIISRNLISKDGRTAKKAVWIASVCLLVFSVVITLISMWTYYNESVSEGLNPLVYLMKSVLPLPISILLFLALVSTLISSADTCLINAATIVEHDLFGQKDVRRIRIFVVVIGILALLIALHKTDIINLLLSAYSIYSPGIVFPLTVSLLFYKKRRVNEPLWFTAVLVGSVLGGLYSYLGIGYEWFPLLGMFCSLVISLIAVRKV